MISLLRIFDFSQIYCESHFLHACIIAPLNRATQNSHIRCIATSVAVSLDWFFRNSKMKRKQRRAFAGRWWNPIDIDRYIFFSNFSKWPHTHHRTKLFRKRNRMLFDICVVQFPSYCRFSLRGCNKKQLIVIALNGKREINCSAPELCRRCVCCHWV